MAKQVIDLRHKYGDIFGRLKNVVYNAFGVDRSFEELLQAKDIDKALGMMQDRDDEVEEARTELDTEMHYEVLMRPDRTRKGLDTYTAEKLPRALQNYINYVEYFFLLNYPVQFRNDTIVPESEFNANDEAYKELERVLKDIRFDALLEDIKLIAGGETEAALAFDIEKGSDGIPYISTSVLSASNGYKLRPLFDRKQRMLAFAYGWKEYEGKNREVDCWQIETNKLIFTCRKIGGLRGWDIQSKPNLSGKINVVYVQQPKAWEGVQRRIERREMLDSKAADTGNYVYAPLLVGKSDAVISLPDIETAGVNAVQLKGEDAEIKYLQAPNAYEQYKAELQELDKSIFTDALCTPIDPYTLSNMGDISGIAIKRISLLSYIKNARMIRIYEMFVDRVISILKANIGNITAIRYKEQLDKMIVGRSFQDPFPPDPAEERKHYAELYEKGVISLYTAVEKCQVYDNLEQEIERIMIERGQTVNSNNNTQNIE
jgi:hypothetical protein